MTLDEYQHQAMQTDLFDQPVADANNPALIAKILGLSGEAGEVAEKFKKIIRDRGGNITEADRDEIVKELGDVLWYISALSRYMDRTLETVAQANLDKVLSRKARGVTKGSGDNR